MIYEFQAPLLEGHLIRRYKRFLADVEVEDGRVVTAHCVNTGSMRGCCDSGARVYLSIARNPTRKLGFTWEIIDVGTSLVGVNTSLPNRLVRDAILDGRITELSGYETLRSEVPYGERSRIDLLLNDPARGRCYVEVKNVTLRDGGVARFPDARSVRGFKHLVELEHMVREGHRAVMVFLVQRTDCDAMGPADSVDPDYGRKLRESAAYGVEVLAYRATVTPESINIDHKLPILL